HLRRDLAHITRLRFYQAADHLILDATSLRNLEVHEPLHRDAARNSTLFGALNRTTTPMGARRLRDWLTQPLAAVDAIYRRQDAVQGWIENPSALANLRTRLAEVGDLERLISRLSVGTGNARDLVAVRLSLEQIPALRGILLSLEGIPAERHRQDLTDFA